MRAARGWLLRCRSCPGGAGSPAPDVCTEQAGTAAPARLQPGRGAQGRVTGCCGEGEHTSATAVGLQVEHSSCHPPFPFSDLSSTPDPSAGRAHGTPACHQPRSLHSEQPPGPCHTILFPERPPKPRSCSLCQGHQHTALRSLFNLGFGH